MSNQILAIDGTQLLELSPPAIAPASESAAILSMIERAARDPSVDIEKFGRLMAMRERVEAKQEQRDFNAAIAEAKGEIGPIVRNSAVDFTSTKGRTNYRYEDFAAVAAAVDPVFKKHGLVYRFRSEQATGRVRVTCIISLGSYAEETTLEAPEDHSGNKNTIQAVASSAQYLMRYTLKLALGLAVTDKDDDGVASVGSSETITADQYGELLRIAESVNATEADDLRLCKKFGVKFLQELPASKFQDAVTALKQMGSRK